MDGSNLLDAVRRAIGADKRPLTQIAQESRVPYATLWRIARGRGDPSFSHVQTLYEFYHPPRKPRKAA